MRACFRNARDCLDASPVCVGVCARSNNKKAFAACTEAATTWGMDFREKHWRNPAKRCRSTLDYGSTQRLVLTHNCTTRFGSFSLALCLRASVVLVILRATFSSNRRRLLIIRSPAAAGAMVIYDDNVRKKMRSFKLDRAEYAVSPPKETHGYERGKVLHGYRLS